jgi:hypothetical protein
MRVPPRFSPRCIRSGLSLMLLACIAKEHQTRIHWIEKNGATASVSHLLGALTCFQANRCPASACSRSQSLRLECQPMGPVWKLFSRCIYNRLPITQSANLRWHGTSVLLSIIVVGIAVVPRQRLCRATHPGCCIRQRHGHSSLGRVYCKNHG